MQRTMTIVITIIITTNVDHVSMCQVMGLGLVSLEIGMIVIPILPIGKKKKRERLREFNSIA